MLVIHMCCLLPSCIDLLVVHCIFSVNLCLFHAASVLLFVYLPPIEFQSLNFEKCLFVCLFFLQHQHHCSCMFWPPHCTRWFLGFDYSKSWSVSYIAVVACLSYSFVVSITQFSSVVSLFQFLDLVHFFFFGCFRALVFCILSGKRKGDIKFGAERAAFRGLFMI